MASKVHIIRRNLLALSLYLDGQSINSRGTAILMIRGLAGSRKAGCKDGAMNTIDSPDSASPSARAAANHPVPESQIFVTRQVRLINLNPFGRISEGRAKKLFYHFPSKLSNR